MEFTISPRAAELAGRAQAFVHDEVVPLERQAAEHPDGLPWETVRELRARARAAGLYAPQLPVELGGQGLDLLECCPVFEAAGRSLLGPLALNCSAPDEGNMHLLHHVASPEQQDRYLRPLAEGELYSCFAMTEPAPGAGSDPTMIRTRAEKRGDHWVINGHKWYATGGDGAGFYLVMARTDPDAPAVDGCTLFLVDAGTPGLTMVRRIEGLTVGNPGGHCELLFEDCAVHERQVLGAVGKGFKLTQVRLGPARLTHCMRWTGVAQRALEIATARAQEREAFGNALGRHEAVQWMLADSAIELHAARLMTQQAAWLLTQGQEARQETAMCKVFVSETVNRVIDRAIQVCGSLGIADDTPLHAFYREARAFRIYDGPSEVHRMVIARQLLKKGAGG
ncbi:MAG TPA: acyl-CoA dehydrogenase family protein [Roseiflexaceae bacterium]|nr:acyl-CoA dehydrogenase family protein [Roseiflexaceae bacterium]